MPRPKGPLPQGGDQHWATSGRVEVPMTTRWDRARVTGVRRVRGTQAHPHPCDLCGATGVKVPWFPPLLARVCEECRDRWHYRQARLRR